MRRLESWLEDLDARVRSLGQARASLEEDVRSLREARASLEEHVTSLREALPAWENQLRAEPAPLPAAEQPVHPILAFPTSFAPASDASASASDSADTQVFPGVLEADDRVSVTESSKPMVQIRWSREDSTAQVWVNREYKFGDTTVAYLHSAFDLDQEGPGAYETIAPATVQWSANARTGRVVSRGRVRALGG